MPRRRAETIVLCMLSLGLVCLIFFAPATGPAAREFLMRGNVSPTSAALLRENEVLQAKVAALSALAHESSAEKVNGIIASVYSIYPFGGRSELTIDTGSADGIHREDAVLFEGTLIGKVGAVSRNAASVITIFDNSFSLTVRVASSGVNGLLTGGNDPVISSMPKDADIAQGDIVISAVPGLPYGLALGEVGIPVLSSNTLFLEAPLMTAYDLEDIKAVTVMHIP